MSMSLAEESEHAKTRRIHHSGHLWEHRTISACRLFHEGQSKTPCQAPRARWEFARHTRVINYVPQSEGLEASCSPTQRHYLVRS